MTSKTQKLLALLDGQPVIPVLKIERAADAVPLARALARGGLRAIEITLRTDEALECIRRVAAEVEDCIVGAGTILSARHFDEAVAVGSKFIVSPGLTRELAAHAAQSDVPLLPGTITPGEIMGALEAGLDFLKFFPAEQAGGASFLKALALAHCRSKILPDRWHLGQERQGLSQPAERRLRRRLVGRPPTTWSRQATGPASRRLPPKRTSCARTEFLALEQFPGKVCSGFPSAMHKNKKIERFPRFEETRKRSSPQREKVRPKTKKAAQVSPRGFLIVLMLISSSRTGPPRGISRLCRRTCGHLPTGRPAGSPPCKPRSEPSEPCCRQSRAPWCWS
jgi:2-dehydro-3-deoxyphosphogluconate aldolase/(4S)-4-hydroxy-2-oxoglutarate aldolase